MTSAAEARKKDVAWGWCAYLVSALFFLVGLLSLVPALGSSLQLPIAWVVGSNFIVVMIAFAAAVFFLLTSRKPQGEEPDVADVILPFVRGTAGICIFVALFCVIAAVRTNSFTQELATWMKVVYVVVMLFFGALSLLAYVCARNLARPWTE